METGTLEVELLAAVFDNDLKTLTAKLWDGGKPANVNFMLRGWTMTGMACRHGHVDMVRLLTRHPGFDVNYPSQKGSAPPISVAFIFKQF